MPDDKQKPHDEKEGHGYEGDGTPPPKPPADGEPPPKP